MKILQLCHKPPIPSRDGGCIAMNNVTQGLLALNHKVKILTIFTKKHDFTPEDMPAQYIQQTDIEGVYVDTNLNVMDAFSSIMTNDSYNISRFFSTDFDIRLTKELRKNQYDIIHLESLFMTPYLGTIKRLSKAPVVLRAHNLEYVIWEKMAGGAKGFFKKNYLQYLSGKLKQYELEVLASVSGIATISDDDQERFQSLGIRKPMRTIPFGLNLDDYPVDSTQETELALFHLGSMDWIPNMEGCEWFLNEIWPAIHALHPQLKLYLAGRNMPDEFRKRNDPNVIFVGEVDDARTFIQSKAIMIVPLLSAGGIRVKIIEGMALGKTIISTQLGAEGIHSENHKNILIADTKEQWIKSINELMTQPSLMNDYKMAGRQHVEQHFSNIAVVKELVDFYKTLIKR